GAGARPARVFPLGLGRQAVAHAFGLAQPLRHRHRVVPGDVDDGVIVALREARIPPRILRRAPVEGVAARALRRLVRGVVAVAASAVGDRLRDVPGSLDEAPELADRHLVLAELERPRHPEAVHRRLDVNLYEETELALGLLSRPPLTPIGA